MGLPLFPAPITLSAGSGFSTLAVYLDIRPKALRRHFRARVLWIFSA
jgi:hypothetical protein